VVGEDRGVRRSPSGSEGAVGFVTVVLELVSFLESTSPKAASPDVEVGIIFVVPIANGCGSPTTILSRI